MANVAVLGIDIAKNVFQLHGVDADGQVVLRRRVMRDQLLQVTEAIPPWLIGIEACTGAFHWQRHFEAQGHTVKIIAPQYVKPFVKGQKSDGNDARAICIVVQKPHMRFVPKKSIIQQDIQGLHRARQRLVNHRVALISQMRGLLLERGVAIAKSASIAQRTIPEIINNPMIDITELTRDIIGTLHAFLLQLNEKIRYFDRQIEAVFRESDAASVSPRYVVSAQRLQRQSLPLLGMEPTSRMAGTWRHGWALCRDNIPAAIGVYCWESASEAVSICEHSWSMAGGQWCERQTEIRPCQPMGQRA